MAVNIDERIEQVYRAFSVARAPTLIEACPCCLNESNLCELLKTPLRQLTPSQLYEYAFRVLYTAGSEADFRYFLPRILEIACREPDRLPDLETVLRKLDLAGWMQWDASEIAALRSLFEAAFEQALVANDDGWAIDSWICGLALAGFDIVPLLQKLEDPEHAEALISYYERNSQGLQKEKLGNSFWNDDKAKAQPVIDWFRSVPVQTIIHTHYGTAPGD